MVRARATADPGRAVLVIACLAQFMVVLDISIVNVALPAMRRALDLTPAGQQWIVNAYTLVFGGCLLFGGRAADIYGRRRACITGLVVFSVSSPPTRLDTLNTTSPVMNARRRHARGRAGGPRTRRRGAGARHAQSHH